MSVGLPWEVAASRRSSRDPMAVLLASYAWEIFATATDRVEVAGVISRLNDQSGNGRHLDQVNAINRPSVSPILQNGRELAQMGANKYFLFPTITLTTVDVFCGYFREVAHPLGGYLYCRGPGGSGLYPEYCYPPGGWSYQLIRGGFAGFNAAPDGLGWNVIHQRWDDIDHLAWVNDVSVGGFLGIGPDPTARANGGGVGSDTNGVGTWVHRLGFFLVHAGLSDADAQDVRAVLAAAYG